MDSGHNTVKLVQPTDFLILEALEEHGRNVATNLSHHIDKDRKNINNRLPQLRDYGLVEKIGPAEKSGLYEITKRGSVVLEFRHCYEDTNEFEKLVDDYLEKCDSPNAE